MGSASVTELVLAADTKMKICVLLPLLAVLLTMLPHTEAGVSRGRNGRRQKTSNRRGRLGKIQARRGRQDEDAPEDDVNDLEAASADEGSGEALPNGCDPNTNIGGFLVFKGVKIWCGTKGVTDFGPYGGLPVEGSGEEASEDVPEEVPEEGVEARRARRARKGRKGRRQGRRNGRKGKAARAGRGRTAVRRG